MTNKLVISLAKDKGGSTGSTAARYMAKEIAKEYPCVVIDLDYQPRNVTREHFGIEDPDLTMADVLRGNKNDDGGYDKVNLKDILIEVSPNLFIAPSSRKLKSIEQWLNEEVTKFVALRMAISKLDMKCAILIDVPTGLGTLSINALTACNYVISPVKADPNAWMDLGNVVNILPDIQAAANLTVTPVHLGCVVGAYRADWSRHTECLRGLAYHNYNVLGSIPMTESVTRRDCVLTHHYGLAVQKMWEAIRRDRKCQS